MSNPFKEIPQKARNRIYVVLSVILIVATAWQAAEGNLLETLVVSLGALQSILAAANSGSTVAVVDLPPDGYEGTGVDPAEDYEVD